MKMLRFLFLVPVFVYGCCGNAAASDGGAIIIGGSSGSAVIVLGADSPEADQYASNELAKYLGEITGAKYEVSDKADADKVNIYVGEKAARQIKPDLPIEELETDGIIIQTDGRNLILAGDPPRGTLYAVYTFLDDLGCRWWSSDASTIPSKPEIVVKDYDLVYNPPLEYREPYWYDAFNGDWAARNKNNGHRPSLESRHGGKHVYCGFVHTFYSLIPPDKYFKDHPEWFSEIKGKRKTERAQLCLSNEQMRKELVKNLKEKLRSMPEATIASVSQNDWYGYCTCPECSAIYAEEGSQAGAMIRFVNKVAEDIEEEFPEVAISTLAYQYTRKPPKLVKPRENVIVRLCSIECSFGVPFEHERNKAFQEDIIGWSKICDRLYIWDYVTNFKHHVLPHPNLNVLGPNVKFLVDHGAKGIFEQGAYSTNGAEMAELRAWVLAKLLWDPSLDSQKLIDEFLAGYYGPAGKDIKAYLELIHNESAKAGDYLGCFAGIANSKVNVGWHGASSKFISYEVMAKSWNYLQSAEKSVSDDAVLRFRVQCAELPVMYAFMMCWKEMRQQADESGIKWPMPESIDEVYVRFVEIAKKKNITRLNEWEKGYGNIDKALVEAKK